MQTNKPANLRRWERVPTAIPISLVLKGEKFKKDNSATTIGVSLSGMGVRTALVLVPGEWVGIVAKGAFPHAIPTRVVWAREEASTYWTIAGLDFVNTLAG